MASCADIVVILLGTNDAQSGVLWNEQDHREERADQVERGEKTPTPKISALLRKRPVLLRANFVLTKDRKRPYYRHFCGKLHREGSCSKAAGGP